MKTKYYYCSTWRENFWFYLGWNPSDVMRQLRKTFYFEDLSFTGNAKTIELEKEDGRRAIVIWTRKKNDIPSLTHECVHAANFCLAHKGVKILPDNDEPQAYLTEALVRAALK